MLLGRWLSIGGGDYELPIIFNDGDKHEIAIMGS